MRLSPFLLSLLLAIEIANASVKVRIKYTYSAAGVKLRTIHETDMNVQNATVMAVAPFSTETTTTETTDYVGNVIYKDNVLNRILVDGGYIEGGVYYYYMTDHLGNNRVVVNASGTVTQRNHYYPFGTAFAENSVDEQKKQPYKYNAKELDQMHGLNLYDYSARYYESAVGRFTTVDPLAEKYYSISPYVYAGNNPMRFIDPTGMYYIDKTKATIYVANGSVSLKKENLNFVTRARINHMNENPKYWNSGEIGFNSTIGYLSWQKISSTPSSELAGATSSPYSDTYGEINVVNPNKNDGTSDRRYKQRSYDTAAPAASAKGARGMLILDAINTSLETGIQIAFLSDKSKINEHVGLLGNAIQDINNALGQGMIPKEYQNAAGISAILNFVFQSDNITDDKNIGIIGQRIIDEISKKREENKK